MTKDEQKQAIQRVLDGKSPNVYLGQLSLRKFYELLKELDVEWWNDELDTNGWQIDYWQTCEYNGSMYIMHGSAWHGVAAFSANTEEGLDINICARLREEEE